MLSSLVKGLMSLLVVSSAAQGGQLPTAPLQPSPSAFAKKQAFLLAGEAAKKRLEDGAVARAQALLGRAESVGADPTAEGKKAVDAGDYGLIWVLHLGSKNPVGVLCHAPVSLAWDSLVAARIYVSDVPPPPRNDVSTERAIAKERERVGRQYAYATAYNLAIISHPGFPYRDICEAITGGPHPDYGFVGTRPKTFPWSRETADCTQNLGEAARHGTLAEVKRWLTSGVEPNMPDEFRMTPLDWALAHERPDAAKLIAAAGGGTLYPR